MRDGYAKWVLREAMKGILNDQVRLDREKKGFNAGVQSLFDFEDRLIAAGKLQHDFAVIIAKRKPTRVENLLGKNIAYLVSKTRALLG